MKRMTLLAAVVAGLTFSSLSMAVPVRSRAEMPNCKKVAKNVTKVCKTYKKHLHALKALRKQLKADDITPKFANAHINAVKGVFKAIRTNKSKKDVRAKLKKVKSTSRGVLKQLKPLAKEWDNYRAIQKNMIATKKKFEAAYKEWLGASPAIDCKKATSKAAPVCKTFKAHRKAVNMTQKQLKADHLTTEYTKAHLKALKALYKAVAANKSVEEVQDKREVLGDTTEAVVEQVGPLAEKWENYKELLIGVAASLEKFDVTLKAWMKASEDDADDFDDGE